MAINYVRMTVTKRSEGRNAVQISAYIGRDKLHFDGNCVLESKTYDYSKKADLIYNNIILPKGASKKFLNPEYLWNMAEKGEKRKDSQVNMNFVFALPDDKEISDEQRIQIIESFIEKYFANQGLITQVAIHKPEDGNCHAHAMVTMRTLTEEGEKFSDRKIETLEGFFQTRWHQYSRHHQNALFKEWGLSLRVDPLAPIPQEHIGNKRIRARAYSFFEEWDRVQTLNEAICKDPSKVLDIIEERYSVFSKDDVDRFIDKHTPTTEVERVKSEFWKQERIIPLLDKKSHKSVDLFSTMKAIKEEKQIVRLCERMASKRFSQITDKGILEKYRDLLNEEQKEAFDSIVLSGKGLSFIQGYAGTGKSYLLKALFGAYREMGRRVRVFGPDNATSDALAKTGINGTENIYRFLFGSKFGFREIREGDVWIVDETGKLGNRPFKEFVRLAEKKGVQVISCGDPNQLSPIERGDGMLKHLCTSFGCENLKEVQRHKLEEDRAMNKELAIGSIGAALDRLHELRRISWAGIRKEAMENLIKKWSYDNKPLEGQKTSFSGDLILAASRKELVYFNQAARNVRKLRGELGDKEFSCVGINGKILVSRGDWIELRKNDREKGIQNGDRGELVEVSTNSFTVAVVDGEKKTKLITFDPREFHNFQLGYATTLFRAQGHTKANAYMMHSLALNLRMIYVGLTRHVWDVFYFTSRDEVHHLSHLKWLARRVFEKGCTQKYTFKDEVDKEIERKERQTEIERLKSSDALTQRVKGHGKHLLNVIKSKVSNALDVHEERKESKEFYHIVEEKKEKTEVTLVPKKESDLDPEDLARRVLKEDTKKNLHVNLSKQEREAIDLYRESFLHCWRLKEKLEKEGKSAAEDQSYREAEKERDKRAFEVKECLSDVDLKIALGKKQAFFVESQAKNAQERIKRNLEMASSSVEQLKKEKNMSIAIKEPHKLQERRGKPPTDSIQNAGERVAHQKQEERKTLTREDFKKSEAIAVKEEYFHWYKEARRLRKIIEQERRGIPNRDITKCPHYKEFNEACIHRNKAASSSRIYFGKNLESAFGEKAARFIRDQSAKHDEVEKKIQEHRFVSDPREFGDFLSRNTELIVEKLFPEGAITSSAKEWRFGKGGHLSVKKDGYFFDFEAQEGGGLLKLVQRETGTDTKGAINWIKDAVGGLPVCRSNDLTYLKTSSPPKVEERWMSLRPDSKIPPPKNRETEDGFKEIARHAYRDADGRLLYYSVRMEDGKGNKRVVPLSFGYKEGEENKPFWKMKAYDFGKEKRTIYNLHLLKKYPTAPVVIVEGEKTADAAPQALKEIGRDGYIAISWSGGARSVAKTDWSPLAGREKILIWPDNDEAGLSAGKMIEKELFNIKVQKQEFKTVDPVWIQQALPEGWDLADKWPVHLSREEKRDASYGFRISELQDRFEFISGSRNKPFGERLVLSDLSVRFLEARRESYEKEGFLGKTNFGKEKFLMSQAEELNALFGKEQSLAKKFGEDPHINASGDLQQDLVRQCTLFEAKNGREANLSEILVMKDAIREAGKLLGSCSIRDLEIWKCVKQRTLEGICEKSLERGSSCLPSREEIQRQVGIQGREIQKAQTRELTVQREMQKQKELDRGFDLSL